MTIRKDRKNGGAVKPCALTLLKPISFRTAVIISIVPRL